MPDVPSLSLALISLYFFVRWIDNSKSTALLLAAIAISLSILVKVTSIVVATPLLFLAWKKWRWNVLQRVDLWLFGAITVVPSIVWYWHAHQIAESFYPYHFFGEGGFRMESFSWYSDIVRQTATSSLTPILSMMALIGLFVAWRSKPARSATALQAGRPGLFYWWLAGMILFIVVTGYGNRHRWYQLPFVPIAAGFAGAACAFIGSKIASSRIAVVTLSILLATSFAVFAYLNVRPFYKSSAAQLRDAGLELQKITARDALIVAADTGDPTIFYYAERKGWHFLEEDGIYDGNPSDSQQAIVDLERLRRDGATHLVFTTNTFWWLEYYPEFARHLDESAVLMEATPRFIIYKLTAAAK
jgi:hypothetical protein